MRQHEIISSSVNIPDSIITLTTFPFSCIGAISCFISDSSSFHNPPFAKEMLITMSSSSASSSRAWTTSASFAEGTEYPNGKPITVATLISLALSNPRAVFTKSGGIQTAANLNSSASLQTLLTSSCDVVGLRTVWSMYVATFIYAASLPWQFLYFLPLPHGQGSFLPTFGPTFTGACFTVAEGS